jgi:hypothetical protein
MLHVGGAGMKIEENGLFGDVLCSPDCISLDGRVMSELERVRKKLRKSLLQPVA